MTGAGLLPISWGIGLKPSVFCPVCVEACVATEDAELLRDFIGLGADMCEGKLERATGGSFVAPLAPEEVLDADC